MEYQCPLKKKCHSLVYSEAILIKERQSCGHSEGTPKEQCRESVFLLSLKELGKGFVIVEPKLAWKELLTTHIKQPTNRDQDLNKEPREQTN